ncbi:MAG: 50S ribosomal protein L5 [Candidatus Omnitrophica bacterium]|nr:50S ribosomal protein L5 [Candidatus Omnitrophota bacterium]
MTEQNTKTKPRLKERYDTEIVPAIMEKFGYKNRFQVPRVRGITINMGLGAGAQDMKLIEDAQAELAIIAGQRAVVTKAKKAISNFKIRKGSAVGCAVTLRKAHMYEFLDRLISIALPRIKDFRGVPNKSFDKDGNYSLGIKEHTIFPELDIDKVAKVKGMTVTITMTKSSKEASMELLRFFGMPFANK